MWARETAHKHGAFRTDGCPRGGGEVVLLRYVGHLSVERLRLLRLRLLLLLLQQGLQLRLRLRQYL